MKADLRYVRQSKEFWAHVRTISQEVGYTDRRTRAIRVPTLDQVRNEFERLQLDTSQIADPTGDLTNFGSRLFGYFHYRAEILNDTVQGLLMDKAAAQAEFKRLKSRLKPACPLPMNKQRKYVLYAIESSKTSSAPPKWSLLRPAFRRLLFLE